ncbi:hypothetical protein [Dehalogenimonas alkenigignens]|nr:hypothetical protein [Dehalogenimonas alkenigignens]PVV83946.1 hypothetical protein DD509_04525 [Dehalogenimonas alkenigignens]
MLLLNYGKLVLEDGLLRFEETGSGLSYLVIWPYGYSCQSVGSRVEILDAEGAVVAKSGQYLRIGGGPAFSVSYYTGEEPPWSLPGPYWALGSIEQWWPWDFVALMELFAVICMMVILTLIALDLIRLRRPKI